MSRTSKILRATIAVFLPVLALGCAAEYKPISADGSISYKCVDNTVYFKNNTEDTLAFKYRVSYTNMGYSTENGTDATLAGHEEMAGPQVYQEFWTKVWDVRPALLSN